MHAPLWNAEGEADHGDRVVEEHVDLARPEVIVLNRRHPAEVQPVALRFGLDSPSVPAKRIQFDRHRIGGKQVDGKRGVGRPHGLYLVDQLVGGLVPGRQKAEAARRRRRSHELGRARPSRHRRRQHGISQVEMGEQTLGGVHQEPLSRRSRSVGIPSDRPARFDPDAGLTTVSSPRPHAKCESVS